MIKIPNERRHPIASGEALPETADELAYLLFSQINTYLWLKGEKEIASALGAIELARLEVLQRLPTQVRWNKEKGNED